METLSKVAIFSAVLSVSASAAIGVIVPTVTMNSMNSTDSVESTDSTPKTENYYKNLYGYGVRIGSGYKFVDCNYTPKGDNSEAELKCDWEEPGMSIFDHDDLSFVEQRIGDVTVPCVRAENLMDCDEPRTI